MLIVNTGEREGLRLRRMYVRHVSEQRYTELPYPKDPGFSYHDPVVAGEAPLLFLSQWESRGGGGFDWRCLLLCELPSLAIRPLLAPHDLVLATGETGKWVASLLGASPTGDRLFCSMGRSVVKPDGRGETVTYELCSLDVSTRALNVHTVLGGVFF